jgi:predicted house-cleaning noncanonical NTP pyrophosphatase (MazG superfamily)
VIDGRISSQATRRVEWGEASALRSIYGPKGALLLALPRAWVPEFVLYSADAVDDMLANPIRLQAEVAGSTALRLLLPGRSVIVRSSVVDESIWERGSFLSVPLLNIQVDTIFEQLRDAIQRVKESAEGRKVAIVLQEYVKPQFSGEFGNLLRVSKTRDHWQVSSVSSSGVETEGRLNSQRDISADDLHDLARYIRPSDPRSFGSIAAWINSVLLQQTQCRVNLEWVFGSQGFFIVQIDEETEDFLGINPFQVRLPTVHSSGAGSGVFIKSPTPELKLAWDKLAVLEELWTANEGNIPLLFAVQPIDIAGVQCDSPSRLADDFKNTVGPDKIIIRTSIRRGAEKLTNLPKSEGLTPPEAAQWCIEQSKRLQLEKGLSITDFCFVTHRLIPARASAWALARPDSPEVEIHVNWGFADALQYYPYDIIDVHVPTKNISYTPQYKSHCILPKSDGTWQTSRVKNEVARSQCASIAEAREIAERSLEIARRLKKPFHIMWFVGCVTENGETFHVPWYWTLADDEQPNPDRPSLRSVLIRSREDLAQVKSKALPHGTFALELAPVDVNLMRDNKFLEEVGAESKALNAPIVLRGSTLAHAYYQLQKAGCTVIPSSARQTKRTRSIAPMGKLVRDKVPAKIKRSEETAWTQEMPNQQVVSFLVGKLVEELLEFRRAQDGRERREELADALEVLLALVKRTGLSIDDVSKEADKKRAKAGGFDQGLILFETSIGGKRSDDRSYSVMPISSISGRTEIPYTFFGFGHFDRSSRVELSALGMDAHVKLENDRLAIQLVARGEQLDLDLEDPDDDQRHR